MGSSGRIVAWDCVRKTTLEIGDRTVHVEASFIREHDDPPELCGSPCAVKLHVGIWDGGLEMQVDSVIKTDGDDVYDWADAGILAEQILVGIFNIIDPQVVEWRDGLPPKLKGATRREPEEGGGYLLTDEEVE